MPLLVGVAFRRTSRALINPVRSLERLGHDQGLCDESCPGYYVLGGAAAMGGVHLHHSVV